VHLQPEALAAEIAAADIIINCTPIGMHPRTDSSPVPADLLEKKHVVFDIVYNPLTTRLLQDAAARGAGVVRGLEMFLNQAVLQLELWTGAAAPCAVMREVLMKKFAESAGP
jgi:shikimate dehydrogenase